MRYVLDSSVGFKWAVIEPDTDKALRPVLQQEQCLTPSTPGWAGRSPYQPV